ncbi:MAG: HEAT repeat protein [Haloarculaceae archaeon]|jgi:HEAT repeat protein
MSNGDDEPDADSEAVELDTDTLQSRLDDAASALENAETEADLDDVETTLDDVAADVEAADFPEPDEDEDEEESEDLQAQLDDRLSELRDDLEEQRGPYAEDVTAIVKEVETTLSDTRWTEDGERDAVGAASDFADTVGETLAGPGSVTTHSADDAADDLADVRETVDRANLDPDDDAETIAELLEAAEQLEAGVDDAEEWDDLTIREQLDAQGFYDVLTPETRRDYPSEWNAVKVYEQEKDVDPMLKALERFDSDFMAENILDALEHIAPQGAFDAMLDRAENRDIQPIRILGRIGNEDACETLHEFLGGGDVKLEKTTLRALGAIGSEWSTQAVANRLAADSPEIRSVAARALGLIGDTRAIKPLEGVLANDDADEVRASAAWALNQIGTERALTIAAQYADDRSYIVQAEAEKATGV